MVPCGRLERWGSESITFRLPTCTVGLEGLGAGQRDTIARTHPLFVTAEDALPAASRIRCEAGRLPRPLSVPAGDLTSAGQYAPIQVRQDGRVDVTGINFTARIPLAGAMATAGPPVARLCVAREEELAQPMVLENFLRILLAHRVLAFGGMLLHSAGVVVDGRAFVFVGRSNAGKTTLSRKADAEGLPVLSDDINLVLPAGDGFAVHSVPFTGEFRRRVPVEPGAVPLGGVLLLEKGPRLELCRVGAAAAVSALFAQSPFVNTSVEEAAGLLESLAGLVAKVPVARLAVTMENGFSGIMNAVEEHLSDV